MTAANSGRYTPVIIIALVAVIVALGWLYVGERAKHFEANADIARSGDTRIHRWKLVTSWPKNFPGLGTAPEKFAELVNTMSNGRLQVRVYGAGEIVPAMGVFDAVSSGSVQMGHSAAYYWKGKLEIAPFFTSVPFGMTAQEMNAWLHYGGGMELWREAYEPFNLIPFAAGNTGVQMAGWFNKELDSGEDLPGLKMRIPGIGGEVFQRAGGSAVTLPGGELYTSLQTGVIDATEWVSPYNDRALGLHEVARYYYYPGWQEPGPTLELIVNKDAFESLPEDLRAMVEVAARYVNQDMLDEYTARNGAALEELVEKHNVELRRLPDEIIKELHEASKAHIRGLIDEDNPFEQKVYESWKSFYDDVKEYHRISEKAYIEARDL